MLASVVSGKYHFQMLTYMLWGIWEEEGSNAYLSRGIHTGQRSFLLRDGLANILQKNRTNVIGMY